MVLLPVSRKRTKIKKLLTQSYLIHISFTYPPISLVERLTPQTPWTITSVDKRECILQCKAKMRKKKKKSNQPHIMTPYQSILHTHMTCDPSLYKEFVIHSSGGQNSK